jgi:hypothetical protein
VNVLARVRLELDEMQAGTRSDWSARLVWRAARGRWPRDMGFQFGLALLLIEATSDAPTRTERLMSRARALEILVDEFQQQRDLLAGHRQLLRVEVEGRSVLGRVTIGYDLGTGPSYTVVSHVRFGYVDGHRRIESVVIDRIAPIA